MNNSENAARNLSEWQAMGDWRLMFLYRDRFQKVTLEQVQQAADRYFVRQPHDRQVLPEKNAVRAEIPLPRM